MPKEDIAIRVSGLSKKYSIHRQVEKMSVFDGLKSIFNKKEKPSEEFYALKDISFEIKKGEAVGIIGRNGAGKSTLLKILSQITEPTTGTIEINGTVASVLEVGMGFHPELTGRENVFLSGSLLGISKKEIEKRFDEIVDFAGVEKFIDTPVKHYSSGMYVRLAFSVVANIDADILLFDEIFNLSDSIFQKQSNDKIEELLNKKKTIIFVSHFFHQIMHFCPNTMLLVDGRLISHGNTSHVIVDYLSKIKIHSLSDKTTFLTDHNLMCEWDYQNAPKNYDARLISISIFAKNKTPQDKIYHDEEVRISVVYEKLTQEDGFDFAIIITNLGYQILASSPILNNDHLLTSTTNKGIYCSTVIFPSFFFNESKFSIELVFLKHGISTLFIKNVLDFVVNKNPSSKYFDNFYGPLRPRLNWVTSKI